MRKIVLAILILFVVAEGSYLAYRQLYPSDKTAAKRAVRVSIIQLAKPKPVVSKPQPSAPPDSVSVIFDQYGFEPNQFEVPVGTTIIVDNKSSAALKFEPLAGQPNQPQGMYLGEIAVNSSAHFTLNTTGSWQFEANGNPALRGNVTATPAGQSSTVLNNRELPKYDPSTKSLLLNYTDYGFLPNIITVPVGTKVTVINSTTEGGMQFEELPTDTNQNPALNVGILDKGQSKSFTLNVKGTWHYENSWETTDQGQISAD